MTETRFCKDCKHFRDGRGDYAECYYITHAERDIVYGDVTHHELARNERRIDGSCGPEGRNWEPKLFYRLKALFKLVK